MQELVKIQTSLNAPKTQKNEFGNYMYRSCEDILEAVKKLLLDTACTLTLSDDIVSIADRIYIKATATLRNSKGETEQVTAFARESLNKKGQDEAQITGSCSSYARKYALCGLFAIDDNKDPDATNTHGKEEAEPAEKAEEMTLEKAIDAAKNAKTLDAITAVWHKYSDKFGDTAEFKRLVATKGAALRNGGKK